MPITGRPILFVLLLSCQFFGAENPFVGCWDITPATAGRPRGWWLRIDDAGEGGLRGWFSSAYDGKVNVVDELSIQGDEIIFAFLPKRQDGGRRRLEYRARLAGEKLQGTFREAGKAGSTIAWSGVRAPVLPEKDDGTWKRQRPVQLFNGRDLEGWHTVVTDSPCCWSVRDGRLSNAGKGSDLASKATFWNFEIHLQFKLAPNSNSGLGLRGRYEIQMKDDAGDPPLNNGTGAIYSRIVPEVNAGKGAGKWQDLRARLVGRQVTVVLNGRTIIHKSEIDGPNAIAIDADEARPGPIVFQGDHGAIEFRNIIVTPLAKDSACRP